MERLRLLWIGLAIAAAIFFAIALTGCGGGDLNSSDDGGSNAGDGAMSASDPHLQKNLDDLNSYRAQNGAPALVVDDQLSSFALAGSQQLIASGVPHQHFMQASADGSLWTSGFCQSAGENQAPGWPASNDSVEDQSIDQVLAQMMAEGPGGGHHDNIVNPAFTRVGIAIVVQQGQLWLTNDFSSNCQ